MQPIWRARSVVCRLINIGGLSVSMRDQLGGLVFFLQKKGSYAPVVRRLLIAVSAIS